MSPPRTVSSPGCHRCSRPHATRLSATRGAAAGVTPAPPGDYYRASGPRQRVLAGGVTSSWQITQPRPAWLSHGSGGKVYDVDGNEYVDLHGGYGDLHGGYGAALAGHAHPAIVRAVKAQVERHPFRAADGERDRRRR